MLFLLDWNWKKKFIWYYLLIKYLFIEILHFILLNYMMLSSILRKMLLSLHSKHLADKIWIDSCLRIKSTQTVASKNTGHGR